MPSFGEIFRRIRTSKNYTIDDLASATVSKSAISRFERGEGELSFSKVIYLLGRLHVSSEEFLLLSKADEIKKASGKNFSQMILSGDCSELRSQIDSLQSQLNQEFDQFTYLNLIMFEYQYGKLTDQAISENKIADLVDYLFSCEFWTYYELTLFGNTLEAIPFDTCMLLSKELNKKSHLLEQNRQHFETLINVLENIALMSLHLNRTEDTKAILTIVKGFNMDETYLLERAILMYVEGNILRRENNPLGEEKIKKSITIFKNAESLHFYEMITDHLSKIE